MTAEVLLAALAFLTSCAGGLGWFVKYMLAQGAAMTAQFISHLQHVNEQATQERAVLLERLDAQQLRHDAREMDWRKTLDNMSGALAGVTVSLDAHTATAEKLAVLEERELSTLTRIEDELKAIRSKDPAPPGIISVG